jgi:DNA repair protein RecO (recombination protein O)
MNELIMRLTHRAEPQIELFSVYDVSLRQLCLPRNSSPRHSESSRVHLQLVLRQFEINLLQSLGYGLVLNEVAGKGEKVRSDLIYDFQLETGPVEIVEPHQETFGVKVSGKTLLALANNSLEENSAELEMYKEAKQLLRFVLDRYLGNKPLVSRQLLRRKSTVPQSNAGITPVE